MTGEELTEWHSGTGKVIRVGDVVRLDSKAFLWRVRRIVERPSTNVDVYVAGWGKSLRARDAGIRVFPAARLTTERAATKRALQVDAEMAAQKVSKRRAS